MEKGLVKRLAIVLCSLVAALVGCQDAGTGGGFFTQPLTGDHSNIADARARWKAYGLTNYVIEQQHACFCLYGGEVCKVYVRNNKIVDVIKKSDGTSISAEVPQRFKTVDELFALAGSINPDSVASLVIQYDARFGYPTLISVDLSTQIADEEYAYHSHNIERLLN